MLYCAAFDVRSQIIAAPGTITLKTSGKPDISVNLTQLTGAVHGGGPVSSKFFHWQFLVLGDLSIQLTDRSGAYRRIDISVTPFENVLTAALIAAATSAGWTSPSTILFDMSLSTGIVTASYAATFEIEWSTAGGRALCGFTADKTGADSYTGVVPMFVIKPTLRKVSNPTPNRQERGIASAVRSDSGAGYRIKREVAALRRTWAQNFEVRAKVERAYAVNTHPMTFEEQFDHGYPFIVYDGGFGYTATAECFSYTGDAKWDPQGGSPDGMRRDVMHVPFDGYVEGQIS